MTKLDDLTTAPSDLVTMTQLGRHFGVSQPTIRHYLTKGMPFVTEANRKKGIAWEFSLSECKEWFEQQEQAKTALHNQKIQEQQEDAGIIAARIKKLNIESDRLSLRLAKERGELVEIQLVAQLVESQMTTLRTHLLALPIKLTPILIGQTDAAVIKETISSYIREALEELSEDSVLESVVPEVNEDVVYEPDKRSPLDELLGVDDDD